MLGETTFALHRMHQVAVDGDVEAARFPGDDLDGREPRAELVHKGLSEIERLPLVAAFGAVGDLHPQRLSAHTATRLTSSRARAAPAAPRRWRRAPCFRASAAARPGDARAPPRA